MFGGLGFRRRWRRKVGSVLLTLAIFGLPATITFSVKHVGHRGTQAEVHLQGLIAELRLQDGLKHRLVRGIIDSPEVRSELVLSRRRGVQHLARVKALGLPSTSIDLIVAVTHRYSLALDEEVRLVSLNEEQKALDFEETRLEPALRQSSATLQNQADLMFKQSQRGEMLSDLGLLATGLLSLTMVSLVQSRRRRLNVSSQARQQSERRYRTLIDHSSDLVLVVDRAGRADFLSPSVERLLARPGEDPATALVTTLDSGLVDFVGAVDPEDRAALAAALHAAAPGRISTSEFRITGEQGTCTFEVSIQDLTANPSVKGLVLTAHDVSDRLVLHHLMEHKALHDSLTGLPNRALLADRFDRALLSAEREGTRVGLLLLDLDRFKEVNDTFGHHYGDELLRQIGPRLSGVLRGADTIARLGGDEFTVLLPDVRGVDDATRVATALLAALALPFHVEGVDLDVEASVGVVISGEHGQDAITLMKHADVAMYAAKTLHLGVAVYDPSADGHSPTKLALAGDLRWALGRAELVLHYQPKVRVSTGEVIGAEALVRWQHPVHGLLLPEEFVPLAENTGLIVPLSRYLLDAALAQARVWLDAGRPLPIAVNMSVRNLHDDHFPDQVAKLVALHGVPPELLELEVTESAIMIDPVQARRTLEQLSVLGVRLSIDDFGVGYTTLSQLTLRMPISEIKIDRSFVRTIGDDPAHAVIVRSLVDLGHNLGLTLVAEGIETENALAALAGLGCDVVQGYYLSRPVTADAFDTWCTERLATDPARDESVPRTAGRAPVVLGR